MRIYESNMTVTETSDADFISLPIRNVFLPLKEDSGFRILCVMQPNLCVNSPKQEHFPGFGPE